MKTLIKCVNVNYEESGIGEFNGEKQHPGPRNIEPRVTGEFTNPIRCVDIELNVQGINTLTDSFWDYTAVKMLDGEFKYQAGGLGLQDARKRVIFRSLPPVLHLQLKRYRHDIQRGTLVKVRILCALDGLWYDPNPTRKINDRFEFPSKSTLPNSLTRRLTGPNPGSTSFTV